MIGSFKLFAFPAGTAAADVSRIFGLSADAAAIALDNTVVMREGQGAYRLVDKSIIEEANLPITGTFRFAGKKWKAPVSRKFVPKANTKLGFVFVEPDRPTVYQFKEGAIQQVMKEQLEEKFSGDIDAMSDQTLTEREDLESMIEGVLPKMAADVREIAELLDIDPEKMVERWESDALEAIDYVKPIPPSFLPAKRRAIELVRLATIHAGGFGPVKNAFDASAIEGVSYQTWLDVFKADLSRCRTHATFSKIVSGILLATGIVSEAEVIVAMEDILREEEELEYMHAVEHIGLYPEPPDRPGDAIFEEILERVWVALESLPLSDNPRHTMQYKIIRMSFGFEDGHDYTIEEIADHFGVSSVRIWDSRQGGYHMVRRIYHKLSNRKVGHNWLYFLQILETMPYALLEDDHENHAVGQ